MNSEDKQLRNIFNAYDDAMSGEIPIKSILEELEETGLNWKTDVRFNELKDYAKDLQGKSVHDINFNQFEEIMDLSCGSLIKKSLTGDLTIPDFAILKEKLIKMMKEVESNEDGECAEYIP